MKKPLSNVQFEILQAFNYSLSETELASFRMMLTNYFANKISADIDLLFEERGWNDDKLKEWAKTHERTSYGNEG